MMPRSEDSGVLGLLGAESLRSSPVFDKLRFASEVLLPRRPGQKNKVVTEDAQPDRGGKTLKSAIRAAQQPIRAF